MHPKQPSFTKGPDVTGVTSGPLWRPDSGPTGGEPHLHLSPPLLPGRGLALYSLWEPIRAPATSTFQCEIVSDRDRIRNDPDESCPSLSRLTSGETAGPSHLPWSPRRGPALGKTRWMVARTQGWHSWHSASTPGGQSGCGLCGPGHSPSLPHLAWVSLAVSPPSPFLLPLSPPSQWCSLGGFKGGCCLEAAVRPFRMTRSWEQILVASLGP